MGRQRNKAIRRKASELVEGADALKRISRHSEEMQSLIGEATEKLEVVETKAAELEGEPEHTDASLTTASDDELRRRAIHRDDAIAERCRRSKLPAAA